VEPVRFHSFRARLVIVFVGLFAVVLAVSLLVVAAVLRSAVRGEIGEELRLAATLFVRQLDARSQQLVGATRLLSGDYALKTVLATADHATTRSVLENHRRRIGADLLMLVSLDGAITADTRPATPPGATFALPRLLEGVEQTQDLSWVVPLDGQLVRLTIVPVLAPDPIAWLCAGFNIDDRTAAELRRLTGLHVSFLHRQGEGFAAQASTLETADRADLERGLAAVRQRGVVTIGGVQHVARAEQVDADVLVVLQRPLPEAFAPYQRLFWILAVIGGAGLVLTILGAIQVARRVSRPVLALADAAGRVAAGDFETSVIVRQRDELGKLAGTFNEMVAGLRDRERVRGALERAERLRRFFSPQVAEALSAGDESVLASHRREITVVFCDLRGFTAFAEAAAPEEVMQLLRDYHAILGPLIARYEGTLERFTGDGLMVFFNDPVPCPDPALRAVRLAVESREAVERLLSGWRDRGYTLGFGTGIAMGFATVGRIGFEGRFDYAAIGTVTNLAHRLCQEAADGQTLISATVYAEVERLVEAVPLGEITLRGFARPLLAFSVLSLRVGAPQPAASGVSTGDAERTR
jgi:class 3 adenylate cyclase